MEATDRWGWYCGSALVRQTIPPYDTWSNMRCYGHGTFVEERREKYFEKRDGRRHFQIDLALALAKFAILGRYSRDKPEWKACLDAPVQLHTLWMRPVLLLQSRFDDRHHPQAR